MIKSIQVIGLFILIILALFINYYPNYYAFLKTPAGYDFSGQASWFDPWDINVYVAAIRWGQNGHLLLENLYSSQSGNGVLLYPVYVLTGYIFRQVQPFLLFHISAVLFGLLFSFVSWILFKEFLKSAFDNILAIFIYLFGGGFGWLFFNEQVLSFGNKIQSADLYMTGFTSLSQLQRPHEAIGMIIYFISLIFFYKAIVKRNFSLNLISLFSLLALTLFYPYYYLSYFLICGFYILLKFLRTGDKYYFKYILINLFIVIPLLYLYFLHLQTNQTFESVFKQHLDTPNLLEVLLGYGILTFFLLLQLKSKKHGEERLFLNLWFFVSIFLSYFPLGFARFYLRGLYFPLVVLSVYAINHLKYNFPGLRKIFTIFVISLVPISTITMFQLRLEETGKNNPWYYQPKEVGIVLGNIPQQTSYKESILTAYNMGNYIPSHSNLRVYFGHFIQTNNSEEKIKNIYNFYANSFSDSDAINFLQQNHIKYIWYGTNEKQITNLRSPLGKLKYSFLLKTGGFADNEIFQINDQNSNFPIN